MKILALTLISAIRLYGANFECHEAPKEMDISPPHMATVPITCEFVFSRDVPKQYRHLTGNTFGTSRFKLDPNGNFSEQLRLSSFQFKQDAANALEVDADAIDINFASLHVCVNQLQLFNSRKNPEMLRFSVADFLNQLFLHHWQSPEKSENIKRTTIQHFNDSEVKVGIRVTLLNP